MAWGAVGDTVPQRRVSLPTLEGSQPGESVYQDPQESHRPCGFHLDLVGTQPQSNDRDLVGVGLSAELRCRLVGKIHTVVVRNHYVLG